MAERWLESREPLRTSVGGSRERPDGSVAGELGVERGTTSWSGSTDTSIGVAVIGAHSRWPTESSWDFVAFGRGHDVEFWARFLKALERVEPDIAVSIEHEDQELDQAEGLR